jgi:hypothetical protein
MVLGSATRAEWVPGEVDTLTVNEVYDETGPQSLAIDRMGTLNLVWRQEVPAGGWRILYMNRPSGQEWSPAYEVPVIADHNGRPALVLDPAGYPHVAWDGLLEGQYEVFYATQRGLPGWETTLLTGATKDHRNHLAPAIAADSSGNIHITWVAQDTLTGETELLYAGSAGGEWTIQVVEEAHMPATPDWSDAGPWITVTPEGTAHVTYPLNNHPGGSDHVHHLENWSPGDTNWTDEAISSDNRNDVYSSIVADSHGDLHLVVTGWSGQPPTAVYSGYYFYRSLAAQEWELPQQLPFLGGTGPVICVDQNGFTHVTSDLRWPAYDSRLLYFANVQASIWRSQTVSWDDGSRHYPSLAICPSGYGHLVFCDNLRHDVPPGEVLYSRSSEPLTAGGTFIRGDVNSDESVSMSDALYSLAYLYVPGSPSPSCVDAMDADDSGLLSMEDAIYVLRFLYVPGNPEPPPPFGMCGYDPTWEGLGCAQPTCETLLSGR